MAGVDIYGADHSPWVQAVLLGLHEKGIPYRIRSFPPLSVFLRSGVMMPAASIDGEPWQLESADLLERVGYARIAPEDLRRIYLAWQGVLHRTDRPLRFFAAFGGIREPEPTVFARLRLCFLRAFVALYMFVLISGFKRKVETPAPADYPSGFLPWQQALDAAGGPFLGGAEPDMRDLMLFGVIQCHASIPVPPLATLEKDPRLGRLREWIGVMQEHFADYGHLYSGVRFEPHAPPPVQAGRIERAAFWLGLVFMAASFPITIPLILFLIARAHRNTGAA